MLTTSQRRGGIACIAGSTILLIGALASGIVSASTTVSDKLYRYPFTAHQYDVLVPVAALGALLVLLGMIGLRRSGVAASSRGPKAVIAGSALLFIMQCVTFPLGDHSVDDTISIVVNALFGVATVLFVVGMIMTARAALRSGVWSSWQRYAPAICAALSLVVLPLQFTGVVWLGIALYGLGYAILGTALASATTA